MHKLGITLFTYDTIGLKNTIISEESKMNYKELLKTMTLEEKVSLLSGKNFWQTRDIEKYDIPSMFLADGPHGIRKQKLAADHLGLNPSIESTCFPTAAALANSFDAELVKEVGKSIGEEAIAQQVNVVLGPGTNIKRNPLCGRNFEYYSEDPYLSGKIASSLIKGIQETGVSACVKHYAVNNQEYRRLVVDSVVDERTLREIYLTPFEMAVKQGKVKTIMSSYNKVNGTYANENNHILREILRNEWGFDGVVVTDWGGNNDRVQALIAGNDLEMPTTDGETNLDILKAIQNNEISEKLVDESVERLLKLIETTHEVVRDAKPEFDVEKHHELALKMAQSSIVLLKNDNKTLPVKENTKVAIIGDFALTPRYQGAGSSLVNPTKLDKTLDLVKDYDIDYIGFEKGFNRFGKKSEKLVKKAISLANKADVVLLYLGLDEASEAEGLDRKDMKLPENQVHLVKELSKLNKKLVAIMSCGSAVELDIVENVDAMVHGYLLGQAGAKALLDVVFGKVNPSGKLAESLPFRYEDNSTSPYFPGNKHTTLYKEGLYVGYRYYDKADVKVRFPFGYGLSYTTFEYSALKVTDNKVSFVIKNTGEYDGSEVVQLYVGNKDSKILRSVKEFKGFEKVYLKKGESKIIEIPFDEYTFRYFNTLTNKYEVEEGTYQIYIGSSSQDIRLRGELEVKGTTEKLPDYSKLPTYLSGNVHKVSDEEFELLLGEKLPYSSFECGDEKRIVIGYNSTVSDLRCARGFMGRLFEGSIRLAYNTLLLLKKRGTANTLMMGVYHQPMRSISRMSGGIISFGQLDGMIMMFNGKFFKGLSKFFKENKIKKIRQQKERIRIFKTMKVYDESLDKNKAKQKYKEEQRKLKADLNKYAKGSNEYLHTKELINHSRKIYKLYLEALSSK